MEVTQPAAKMLVELSKSQDIVAGDGTTTGTVLFLFLVSLCYALPPSSRYSIRCWFSTSHAWSPPSAAVVILAGALLKECCYTDCSTAVYHSSHAWSAVAHPSVPVVILAGALLKECLGLLAKGIHPTIISDALHRAADKAVEVSVIARSSRLSS